ncbi:MAG: hypothetical protein ACRDHW_05445 [Ktedonobacteraceae bacterium]
MTKWAAELVCRRAAETFGELVLAQVCGGPRCYTARIEHRGLNRAVKVTTVSHWQDITLAWIAVTRSDEGQREDERCEGAV